MAVTPQTNTTLEEIANVLRERDGFVLCGHVSPDGDCLGSQLSLMHALKALGKEVSCILVKDEPLPASVSFMPGADAMVPAAQWEGDACVFVGLDVPSRERIGEAACAIRDACELSVTVDHHAWDAPYSDYVYVDPDSASASMLVWHLVKLLCEEPPAESALCAYTGLVTDTGGFRYQNADVAAFGAAADMVAHGASPAFVATNAFQSRTLASLKLEAAVLGRMRLIEGGEASLSWLSGDDMREAGAVKADAEPMVDALRSLSGVRVACMLREQLDDGCVRGSLRAKDATDVSAIAKKFGGGGHRAAAGFTLRMGLEDAVALMEGELSALVAE